MGRFFSSTQIHNPELLSKEQFIELFCDKMKKAEYVTCNSDESEISYILRFTDYCKWVTITTEAYEQGNQLSQTDTSRIAKMLNTHCINTTVIDSDCAVLDLYNKTGKKDDSLIIGRADDYFGDDIQHPSEKIWKQFLCNGCTWEQFTEICNADETFVEDTLSKLAENIGMDSENILFSAEDADEDDSNTEFLHFKKAKPSIAMSQNYKAVNKAPKKLSLNAAFKQIFGELLEPMGFKLVKSKYPYYMRVVGEGIVQVISFSKEKSLNLDPNMDEEGVAVYVGIDLLINPLINFDKNPTIVDNQKWMITLNELYRRFIVYMDGFNEKHEAYSFFYQKGDTEEMLDALKKNRDELMPFVLEFLEMPKTLEDIYQLGEITSGIRHSVIILLGKTDELIEKLKNDLTKKLEMLESVHANKPEFLEFLKERAIMDSEKSIKRAASFKKGAKEYNEFIKTAEETKEKNLITLKRLL